MDFEMHREQVSTTFPTLREIPEPPSVVWVRGELPPRGTKCLAVVGSRDYTNYGKQVVEYLMDGLRGYPLCIISGLALGIDSFAHEGALRNNLYTLAVPGSGLDDSVLYPRQHLRLAQRILESGGGLLSEFEPTMKAAQWTFPKRNRIMVGLADAVLLIEAGEKSGTLITARLTADYNRELLAVPGNIFSEGSKGVHQFLKLGATLVTTPTDILEALNLETAAPLETTSGGRSEEEQIILTLLNEPRDHDSLIRLLPYPPETTLMLLMRMELSGTIREQNGIFIKVH